MKIGKARKVSARPALRMILRGCKDKATWTRGAYARFGNNRVADDIDDPRVCRRCVAGWLQLAGKKFGARAESKARKLLDRASNDLYTTNLVDANDSHGHLAMVKVTKLALHRCA